MQEEDRATATGDMHRNVVKIAHAAPEILLADRQTRRRAHRIASPTTAVIYRGFLVLDPHKFSDYLPVLVSVNMVSSQTSGANTAHSAQTTTRIRKQLRWNKADLCAY